MTKASDNLYPSVLLVEQGSTPASPSAGDQRLFIRTSDHVLCYVNSSGTVTQVGSAASLTSSSAQQSSDVAIGNGSWTDILSLSLAAGTWIVMFTGTVLVGASAGNFYVEVYDGTTEYTATGVTALSTGIYYLAAVISPPITLGGTTTVKIRAQANAASMKMATSAILTNKTGTMVALKIA